MILSKRIALGGQQLDELHDAIVIRSIEPGVTKENITAVDRMGGSGQRITGEHWQTLDVSVTYAINIPKRKMAERRAVFDLVNAWANQKGWLTINWMESKRVYVDKTILPGSGDLWNWTGEFTIVFRAYNVPFWTADTPESVKSGVMASGNMMISVLGNVGSVLDVEFQNMSGMQIDNFQVRANGNRIILRSVALQNGNKLTITHGTDGLLRITSNGANAYHTYSGADDLYVNPGRTAVYFSADRAGILTVTNYGRYV